MAKATRHLHHNEEQYVAKMNFRSERILQSQIDRLNREKLLQVKSLNVPKALLHPNDLKDTRL